MFMNTFITELRFTYSGINEAIDFVQDTVTELTTDKEDIEHPFNLLYKGLSTTPTAQTVQPSKHILSAFKVHTIIPKPFFGEYY